EDAHDAGVLEARRRARLGEEARALRAAAPVVDLERDLAAEREIRGEEDRARPSPTELALDAVAPARERSVRHQRGAEIARRPIALAQPPRPRARPGIVAILRDDPLVERERAPEVAATLADLRGEHHEIEGRVRRVHEARERLVRALVVAAR